MDLINRQAVLDIIDRWYCSPESCNDGIETMVENLPCYQGDWVEIKIRSLTDEEKESYADKGIDFAFTAFDCPLPEDGDEVLITTRFGTVEKTIFLIDDVGGYFEGYEGDRDVLAWMPLPTPYRG